MSIRGIIFDLDGTLLNTLRGYCGLGKRRAKSAGLAAWPISDIKRWIGEGLPCSASGRWWDAPQVSLDQMLPIVSAYYAALGWTSRAHTPAYRVAGRADRTGVPMAILSNKRTCTRCPSPRRVRAVAVRGGGRLPRGGSPQAGPAHRDRNRRGHEAAVRRGGAGRRFGHGHADGHHAGWWPWGDLGYRSREVIQAAGAATWSMAPARCWNYWMRRADRRARKDALLVVLCSGWDACPFA